MIIRNHYKPTNICAKTKICIFKTLQSTKNPIVDTMNIKLKFLLWVFHFTLFVFGPGHFVV